MTLIYYNERFLNHDTGTHPERPARVERVAQAFGTSGVVGVCTRPEWEMVSAERLARVTQRSVRSVWRNLRDRGAGELKKIP